MILGKILFEICVKDSEKPIVKFRQVGVVALERDEKGKWIIE